MLTLFPLLVGTVNTVCFWVQNYFALQNYPREILRKIPSKWMIFSVLCCKHILRSQQSIPQPSAAARVGTYSQLFFGAPLPACHWQHPIAPGECQGIGKLLELLFSKGDLRSTLFRDQLLTFGAREKQIQILIQTLHKDNNTLGPGCCICKTGLG